MRVLQLITDTDRRGAQTFAMDLGDALSRRGHDVSTVAMVPGVAASRLDVPTLADSRRAVGLYRNLFRHARRSDVVIAHGSSTAVSCALSVWETPWVYRQISDPVFWTSKTSRRVRVTAYLRRAAHIVSLSESVRRLQEDMFGIPPQKVTVIPNGIDPGRIGRPSGGTRRESTGRLHLLTINALVPEKGTDLVIDAVAGHDDIDLTIIGDGPDRAHLEERARGVTGARITFHGQVDSAGPYLDDADVVVLASRGGDSMPATLIEAGFRGIPVISTDVGAITEIVVDGETGIIIDPTDDRSLAVAIDGLRDGERRRQLGSAAREHCEQRFHIDVVAAAWDEVLQSVGRRRRTSPPVDSG